MSQTGEELKYNLHPIRLQFLHLKRLVFEANYLPESRTGELFELASSGDWRINVTGAVHNDRATVVACVQCTFKSPDQKKPREAEREEVKETKPTEDPYRLEMEAVAGFSFDPQEISQDDVDKWCKLGSFFILAPYLRNIIAEITRESGFPEILLPLLEVPTFRPPPAKKTLTSALVPHPAESDREKKAP